MDCHVCVHADAFRDSLLRVVPRAGCGARLHSTVCMLEMFLSSLLAVKVSPDPNGRKRIVMAPAPLLACIRIAWSDP